MREVYARSGEELDIGRRGENLATRVIFDVAEWESLYGEGIFHLLHRRNGDKYPYPVVTAYEPGRVIWDVSKTDLAVVGKGLAELQYWAGQTRVKSAVFSTRTAPSLDNEGPVPDEPEASWVEKVLAAAEAILKGSVPPGSGDSGGDGVREPVAYLYGEDKVRLPDIYSVYTPELQEQYGAAVIGVMEDTGEHYLLLYLDYGVYFPRVDDTGSLSTMYAKGCFKAVDGQWIEASKPSYPKAIWSNVNVIYADGMAVDEDVYLYATEPVPVYE